MSSRAGVTGRADETQQAKALAHMAVSIDWGFYCGVLI